MERSETERDFEWQRRIGLEVASRYDPVNSPYERAGLSAFERLLLLGLVIVLVIGHGGPHIRDLATDAVDDVSATIDRRVNPPTSPAVLRLPADGKSNLPGDDAHLSYRPLTGQREVAQDGDASHHGAGWWLRTDGLSNSNFISLIKHVFARSLAEPENVKDFVRFHTEKQSAEAGRKVSPARLRINGRDAYLWTFTDHGQVWHYRAVFPGAGGAILFACRYENRGTADQRRQCELALHTVVARH